jgi:cobalt-zinc-cadmium efflux system outer membrane protein
MEIQSEADTSRREMETNASIVLETRDKLVPLAIKQAEELEEAYERGQAELINVMRARDQQLQFESAALEAEREFHLARIRYESATSSLP